MHMQVWGGDPFAHRRPRADRVPPPSEAQVNRSARYAQQTARTTGQERRNARTAARRERIVDRRALGDNEVWRPGLPPPPGNNLPFTVETERLEMLKQLDRYEDFGGGCEHSIRGQMFAKRMHPEGDPTDGKLVVFDAACRKCDVCRRNRQNLWKNRAAIMTELAARTWWGTLTFAPGKLKFWDGAKDDKGRKVWREPVDQTERIRAANQQFTGWMDRNRASNKALVLRYLMTVELHKSGQPHIHFLMHEFGPGRISERTLAAKWWGGPVHRIKLISLQDAEFRAHYLVKYMTKADAEEWTLRVRASVGYGDEPTIETLFASGEPPAEPPTAYDTMLTYVARLFAQTESETPQQGDPEHNLSCANRNLAVSTRPASIGTKAADPPLRRLPATYFLPASTQERRAEQRRAAAEAEIKPWRDAINAAFPPEEPPGEPPPRADDQARPEPTPPADITPATSEWDAARRAIDADLDRLMSSPAYKAAMAKPDPERFPEHMWGKALRSDTTKPTVKPPERLSRREYWIRTYLTDQATPEEDPAA